jgi:hypothetical protein
VTTTGTKPSLLHPYAGYESSPSESNVSCGSVGWSHLGHVCKFRTALPVEDSAAIDSWHFFACLDNNLLKSLLEKLASFGGSGLRFRVWKVSNSDPQFYWTTPRWQTCSRSCLSGFGGPMMLRNLLDSLPVTTGSTFWKGWSGLSSLHLCFCDSCGTAERESSFATARCLLHLASQILLRHGSSRLG